MSCQFKKYFFSTLDHTDKHSHTPHPPSPPITHSRHLNQGIWYHLWRWSLGLCRNAKSLKLCSADLMTKAEGLRWMCGKLSKHLLICPWWFPIPNKTPRHTHVSRTSFEGKSIATLETRRTAVWAIYHKKRTIEMNDFHLKHSLFPSFLLLSLPLSHHHTCFHIPPVEV